MLNANQSGIVAMCRAVVWLVIRIRMGFGIKLMFDCGVIFVLHVVHFGVVRPTSSYRNEF